MSKLLRLTGVIEDNWTVLRLAEGDTPETIPLPVGEIIFPLSVWQTRKNEIIAGHQRIGLWLDSHESIENILSDLPYFLVIALNFPKFTDGRAYSTAVLLRTRFNYEGELRAIGDVLLDQLTFMRRVGFDSFAVREDKNIDTALPYLKTIPEIYQASTDQPQPLFRRRAA